MNFDIKECLNIIKDVVKDVAIYIMPIAAFVVSIVALKRSNDTINVQVQLSEVEEKLNEYELVLKKYELEKIQAEENEKKKANVEVRIIKIAKGQHRMKVWNSGNATAYNIDVSIPAEHGIIIMKQKIPYEYLEPGDGFEEIVMVYSNATSKFNVISKWKDVEGQEYINEQLKSLPV